MNKIQRRRLRKNVIATVLLTVLALVIEKGEFLDFLERGFYNKRVVWCHRDVPTSNRIIHLDIDDRALDQIGRWPWNRSVLAELVDEIGRAGPKVIAFDLLFSDASAISFDSRGKPIDQDAQFRDSVRKCGNVLLPTSFTFIPPDPLNSAEQELAAILTDNPEATSEECIAKLNNKGFKSITADGLSGEIKKIGTDVMYARIDREMREAPNKNHDQIKARILPHADPEIRTLMDRLFDEQFEHVAHERSMARFMLTLSAKLPPLLRATDAIPPLPAFSGAAKYGAFVDYLPDAVDGTVRTIPLALVYRDRIMPQMGLVVGCAMLNVNIQDVQISDDRVTIPQPNGNNIILPVRVRDSSFGRVGTLMEIPMFGRKDAWLTMYDYPRYKQHAQHVSMYEAWYPILTKKRIETTERASDKYLEEALRLSDEEAANDYKAAPLRGKAKQDLIDATLATLGELIKGMAEIPAADMDVKTKKLFNDYKTADRLLREAVKQTGLLNQQLKTLREDLHQKFQDRAVLVGFTASGSADKVPTSMHALCPGVVVHGTIVNAILTGNTWRVVPHFVVYLVIALMGLLTGGLVSSLPPFKALLATLALLLGYLTINGYVLFHFANLLVGISGPLAAGLLVWSGITIPNFINEIAERNRITKRFSSYVDPSLVSFCIENPDKFRFDGEAREMTMGFTDIQGFTTLTESLGPRTVPLLAEYMGLMIPRIRAHQGYVSRLMGDGIYFFYNAPRNDPDHALHAVSTVLSMHEALDQMNLTLPARNYPTLFMRAGLCTGRVIVGDAGSKEFFDYTAVGDSVNTAARFESANKFFGTKILASARTIELVNGQFLVRPIANIRVVGKTKGTEVFEPLCRMDQVTPQKLKLAEVSTRIYTSFQAAEFEACIAAVDVLEGAYGKSKFSALYRSLSQEYLIKRPEDFNGQVVLSEK